MRMRPYLILRLLSARQAIRTVSTRGRNGCKVRDSVLVFVPPHISSVSRDTFLCLGESLNLKSFNAYQTKWYEGSVGSKPTSLSCDTCTFTIAKPTVTT